MSEVIVKYQDATYSNYKIQIALATNRAYDVLSYTIKENFPDAQLTRTETDYSLLQNKALISVNGYFHPTIYDGNDFFVKNASKCMLKSRTNHIGIHSFMSYPGNLVKTPLTPEMITPDAPYSLYQKLIITLPTPVQSLILIVGGYMQLEEAGVLYRVSDTSFVFHLNKTNYIERLYELARYRDIFTDLDLPVSELNPSMFEFNTATDNSHIVKFMTLETSFAVSVPVTSITAERIYLNQTVLPGTFNTSIEPRYMLMGGYGKGIEYWKQKSEDSWIVNTVDAYQNNYLFSQLSNSQLNIINDHRVLGSTYKLSNAYMLKLSSIV